ncbi:MAG: hypothetical protein ABS79_06640 [Planctomycetes bacterium SCN 63-9]|nr:MAG: hypothetical protein ABS79_06640 [Planctomycetes bacterium SCN 63-9]
MIDPGRDAVRARSNINGWTRPNQAGGRREEQGIALVRPAPDFESRDGRESSGIGAETRSEGAGSLDPGPLPR